MTLDEVGAAALPEHLAIMGALHTNADDAIGEGTLLLLGPHEPGFWSHFQSSPEWNDAAPDPMDRWSRRVISGLATALGGQAFFPFGDTLHPFMRWAIRSARAWSSPVHLLVHDRAGLMISFRGALLLPRLMTLPPPPPKPCDTCTDRPCTTACPAGALTPEGYSLDACHSFLDLPKGGSCLSDVCAVRRSCPISASYGRIEAQSAYHMERFHP